MKTKDNYKYYRYCSFVIRVNQDTNLCEGGILDSSGNIKWGGDDEGWRELVEEQMPFCTTLCTKEQAEQYLKGQIL